MNFSEIISENKEKWIKTLLDVDFKDKDILLKQISAAKVTYNQEYDYISMKFSIDKGLERYPHKVRVPVGMRAFQKTSAPIVFLLHLMDGVVDELEIITADSSQINPDNIDLVKVEYEVNKEVLLL